MADVLYGGNSYSSYGSIGSFTDTDSPGSSGSTLDTGDLRRKFNFGDRVSELSLAQDPFFRFVSMAAKKPTDDPQFKFTEKRGSWNKRYAYVTGWVENNGTEVVGGTGGDADLTAYNDGGAPGSLEAGDTFRLYMAGDYKSAGNIQNVYGQSSGAIAIGASGTRPAFFLPGQIIKVPMSSTDGGGAGADYLLMKITNVVDSLTVDSRECVRLDCELIRDISASGFLYIAGWSSDDVDTQVYDESISGTLEGERTYVVGTTFDKGTGYPETWKDQPYSTGYGQCQIFKTSMVMDNTDRATVLKYEGNEWARIWKEKLIEHKWDIEQSLLFGTQNSAYRTTQGAVDWILNNGNIFSLPVATKSQDSFLDDLSNFLDPRYNNAAPSVFFCSTAVYNWLHKLSGYFANNVGIVQPNSGNTTPTSFPALTGANAPLGRADMSAVGKKKVLGVDTTTISTVYGDINVVRNVHLDGTNVALLGVNMKHCAYRPLVGNGINRDTSIYVGVQTLENSGVDRRVDQILTEAGMEWSMPEAHAIWTNS